MLPIEGLDETEHRRRATIVPLVRSIFTYATYFATAALMLSVLGFNPMPFLAGAGLLGLVVGFGAQSLINDVVSGFFILFENVYLVGDLIETAGARGLVEAIEFRVTKIRDGDGRLHDRRFLGHTVRLRSRFLHRTRRDPARIQTAALARMRRTER